MLQQGNQATRSTSGVDRAETADVAEETGKKRSPARRSTCTMQGIFLSELTILYTVLFVCGDMGKSFNETHLGSKLVMEIKLEAVAA